MSYKVFISSAERDRDLAKDLSQRLRQIGVEVYSYHVYAKKPEEFIITDALRNADELIAIVTSNSLNDLPLMFEIGAGFSLQKRVMPLVVGLGPEELPPIIKDMECINYADLHIYINNLKNRIQVTPP